MHREADVECALASFDAARRGSFHPRCNLPPLDLAQARRLLTAIMRRLGHGRVQWSPSEAKACAYLLAGCMHDCYAAPTTIQHTFEVFRVANEHNVSAEATADLLMLRHCFYEEFAAHVLLRHLSLPENQEHLRCAGSVVVHMLALWARAARNKGWRRHASSLYDLVMQDLCAALLRDVAARPQRYETGECIATLASVTAPALHCRMAVQMLSKLRPGALVDACGEGVLDGMIFACRNNKRNSADLERLVAAFMDKHNFSEAQWEEECRRAHGC